MARTALADSSAMNSLSQPTRRRPPADHARRTGGHRRTRKPRRPAQRPRARRRPRPCAPAATSARRTNRLDEPVGTRRRSSRSRVSALIGAAFGGPRSAHVCGVDLYGVLRFGVPQIPPRMPAASTCPDGQVRRDG
jgi:hypothetical protein